MIPLHWHFKGFDKCLGSALLVSNPNEHLCLICDAEYFMKQHFMEWIIIFFTWFTTFIHETVFIRIGNDNICINSCSAILVVLIFDQTGIMQFASNHNGASLPYPWYSVHSKTTHEWWFLSFWSGYKWLSKTPMDSDSFYHSGISESSCIMNSDKLIHEYAVPCLTEKILVVEYL